MRLAISLLVVLAVPVPAAAAPRDFTAAEVRRLEQGRIVRRALAGNRRGLVGGSSWIVVDAPLDRVWQAMSSVEAYRMMFPRVDRIQVLEQEGTRRLVRIEQEETVGTFVYVVAVLVDPRRHELRFRLDRNHRHLVDDGWGFVRLSPHASDGARTLVSFGAVVDPGDDALVRDLLDERAQRRMLGLPRRLKRQVEGRSAPPRTVDIRSRSVVRMAHADSTRRRHRAARRTVRP